MRFEYDPDADAAFMIFNDRQWDYVEELDDRRNLIFDEDDSVIGIELLSMSHGVDLRGLPHADQLAEFLKENKIKALTT